MPAAGIDLLLEPGSAQRLVDLDRHWASRRTFAYLGQRNGSMPSWLRRLSEILPQAYHEYHFCLLTSGSTGNPKLVVGRKENAEELASVLHQVQDSDTVRETIVALPLSYCYAFVNQWLWSRVASRAIIMSAGFARPEQFRDSLREASDAMLCLVGSQASMLLGMFMKETFPGVIRLHFAGGRFPQEHLAALSEMFPNAEVFNNYGCAEALPRLTVRRAKDGLTASDIGQPISGVELRTTGQNELEFRSPYRCVGLVDEQGFHVIPADRWIRNGDLARVDPSGHWHVVGRSSEVFKRHGEKVAVPQILTTVSEQWSGQAGYYRERDAAGEDGYVLVLSPIPDTTDLQDVMLALRSNFSRAHWPLRIEGARALPLTPNGKMAALGPRSRNDRTTLWRQRL